MKKVHAFKALSEAVYRLHRPEPLAGVGSHQAVAEYLDHVMANHMPRGSGVDRGTQLVLPKSNLRRLVFMCDFHHMNENGMYDGWTEHQAWVTPTFHHDGFELRMMGRNRNGIKDYLGELMHAHLLDEVDSFWAWWMEQPGYPSKEQA